MDKSPVISRRAALVGLAVAAATVSAPVAALASVPRSGGVFGAIAAHKAAVRQLRRAWRNVERLETLPGRPALPRVLVGKLLYQGPSGEPAPIYAYDHDEISRQLALRLNPHVHFSGATTAALQERYTGMHRELTRLIRARKCFDRKSGLPAAEAARTKANDTEMRALTALLLALPATEAEAEAKRRYMRRSTLAKMWPECPGITDALLNGLMRVA